MSEMDDAKFEKARAEFEQAERIKANLYDALSANPDHPDADQIKRVLSNLKTRVGRNPEQGMRPAPGMRQLPVHGELSGGDFGEGLPPTTDEQLQIKGAGDLAKPGIGTRAATKLSDPHKRRELERGIDDMVTFGLGQKAARGVESVFGKNREEPADPETGAASRNEGGFSKKGSAADARLGPGYRSAGRAIGSFIPGATTATFRGAGSLAGGLVSPLARSGMAGRGFAGLLGGAAANTVAAPIMSGSQRAIAGIGEEPLQDTKQGVSAAMLGELTNPVNQVVGGAIGLPVGLAAGIAGSKGQAGRDIRLTESYSATPTPFGGAKGGIFNSPILKGVEGSTREAGAMSRNASRKVLEGLNEEQAGLSREYGAAKKAAGDQGFMEARIDPLFVREAADKLIKGERLTSGQRAAVEAEVNGALDRHPTGMTLDDFNDFRAKLGDIFGTGPKDAAHPALDTLRQAAKRTVDETEMGPINRRYAEGTDTLNKKYEQLGISRESQPRIQEKSIAGSILRRGENTPTAGIQEPAIEEFLQANPKYRPLFDSISLLNAKDRMSLGLEGHGGSLYTRLHGAIGHNIEPLQVGAYRLGMGSEKAIPAASLAAKLLLGQQ